jgi:hypothetical protein
MRALLVPLLLLLPSFWQKKGNKYFLKEVGWTIVLPSDFTVVDNKKAMETSLTGLESNPSDLKILVSIEKNQAKCFKPLLRYIELDQGVLKQQSKQLKTSTI